MRLAVVGTGAIGGSVGGWIASRYDGICLLARGDVFQAIKAHGITLYQEGQDTRQNVHVETFDRMEDLPDVDAVILAVKCYDLEEAADQTRTRFGDTPLIVALQNGVINQSVLPKYFRRVIYGVVGYNAWMDDPGVIGYQKKGPIILGTPNNELHSELDAVHGIFNLGMHTVVTNRFQDAAHCKLVLNLSNSLTTLVGHGLRPITSIRLYQRILSNMLYEGIQIVRAAGYGEFRIRGMPSWSIIRTVARLPSFLTRPIFRKNLKKMVRSSMAQDIIQYRRGKSELEVINGCMVQLAGRHGIRAPYNRAVYELCRQEFSKPVFEPIALETVWNRIRQNP